MFDSLTNPTLLADILIDRIAYRLMFKDYPNRKYMSEERIWRNWLAS